MPHGQLLPKRQIAPHLRASFWSRHLQLPIRTLITVILLVQHDQKGAIGIPINLPLEERPLASLLENLGAKDIKATGTVRIFAGGPVQPDIGFVIHSSDYRQPETIDGRIAMTSSRRILQDIGNYKG